MASGSESARVEGADADIGTTIKPFRITILDWILSSGSEHAA